MMLLTLPPWWCVPLPWWCVPALVMCPPTLDVCLFNVFSGSMVFISFAVIIIYCNNLYSFICLLFHLVSFHPPLSSLPHLSSFFISICSMFISPFPLLASSFGLSSSSMFVEDTTPFLFMPRMASLRFRRSFLLACRMCKFCRDIDNSSQVC